MKRLVGFDLNGWRDLAVRNWIQNPGEDEKIGEDATISGGLGGCVISSGDPEKPHFIGGMQALLAPHGKGDGWGEIGKTHRRISVRDLISSPIGVADQLAATIRGLVNHADVGVLAISDTGFVTEEAQEALLEAMRYAGVRKRLLVWRPVLALLGAMKNNAFEENERVGIISHDELGFGTQVLNLRQSNILTPERRFSGQFYPSSFGLSPLSTLVFDDLIETVSNGRQNDHLKASMIPVRVTLGEQTRAEVLRRSNGAWTIITPPALPQIKDPETFAKIGEALADCSKVFFETPVRGEAAKIIVNELEATLDVEINLLPPETVAEGARVAAGRMDEGEPVFFDFLPQISTIVSGEEGAHNFDMIPQNYLLPAGQTYRSQEPARFAILKGQQTISVFIRKETEHEPRLANILLGQPASEMTRVELSVEQQPVSGRARLTLSSPAFVTPQIVDFDNAEPQERSWVEIIESQSRKPPTVPDRMVLPSGLDAWEGISNRRGLSEVLHECDVLNDPDWKLLAQLMSSRPEGCYALNSDGQPPEGHDPSDLDALDRILLRAEKEVLRRISENENPDNDPLKFATWAFRRCPDSLVEPMLEALDAPVSDHPLLLSGGSRTLMLQGLGRSLRREVDMRKVMDHLFSRPIGSWKKNEVACMGFLISRTDEAPGLLIRKEIDFLASVVVKGLREETGGEYGTTFIYLPILLVGLLRWRLVQPYSLVSGEDEIADKMSEALEIVISDLARQNRNDLRLQKYHDLLCKSRDELAGQGGHSNLLVEIYNLQ